MKIILVVIVILICLAIAIFYLTSGMTQKVSKYGIKVVVLDNNNSPIPNQNITLGDEFETNVKNLTTNEQGEATMTASLVRSSSSGTKNLIATFSVPSLPYLYFIEANKDEAHLLKAKKEPEGFSVSASEIPLTERIHVSGQTLNCTGNNCDLEMNLVIRIPN